MDETLHELVSRYIDGDLDDAESARLKTRAHTDAELAAEIDAAQTLRRAVAALAEKMEPPATLDRVMEPLRQSAPAPARSVRPVYRWLGAAAAVVFGVTVAVEVARRNPEPSLTRPTPVHRRPAPDKDEIFELAPLPTASPDDNRPLGAADHLLQEEPQQPVAPEPDPLEVMGPLPRDAATKIAGRSIPSSDQPAISETEHPEEIVTGSLEPMARERRLGSTGESAGAVAPAPPKAARLVAREDDAATAQSSGKSTVALDAVADGKTNPATGVILRIDGTDHRPGRRLMCPAGTRQVRIEVRENTVVGMELLTDETEIGDGCRLEELLGSILPGVGDGSYLAEVVIQDESP